MSAAERLSAPHETEDERPRLRVVGPDERAPRPPRPSRVLPELGPTPGLGEVDRIAITMVALLGFFAIAGLVAVATAWAGVVPTFAAVVVLLVVWAAQR